MSLAKPSNHCNAFVRNEAGNISLDATRLCKNFVKWKVSYRYGVRYYCTRHKNMYQRGAIEVIRLTMASIGLATVAEPEQPEQLKS